MMTIVIQAGGESSRMGQDKALMPFLGRPLIERQVERLSGVAYELLVTTNRPRDYAFLHRTLIPDLLPGTGALGGLYTALSSASLPIVAVVACDMPFINTDLLLAQQRLLLESEADVVIPRSSDGLEPLHAVYDRDACLPAIRAALQMGERKMISWLPGVRVREMSMEEVAQYDPRFYSFINVNSVDEFRAAEALAYQLEGEPPAGQA